MRILAFVGQNSQEAVVDYVVGRHHAKFLVDPRPLKHAVIHRSGDFQLLKIPILTEMITHRQLLPIDQTP